MTGSTIHLIQSNQKPFSKKLAVFSIGIYIVLSTLFDTVVTNLSVLSSISIYFCAFCCAIFIFRNGKVRFNYISCALLTVGVCFALSILYTPASQNLVSMYLHRYLASVVLIILVSNVITDHNDVDTVINWYVFSGTLLSLFIYYTYGFSNLATSLARIDGRLGNQNIIGISCAFTIILSVYMYVIKKSKYRLLYIASIISCIPAVMFTGSRKSFFIILVALVVFAFVHTKGKPLFTKLFYVFAIVIALYVLLFHFPAFAMIKERMLATLNLFGENVDEALKGDSNRINYVKKGLSEFLKSPIWGNGFCYSYYYLSRYTHNNYVELLMNGGIITFGAYYSVFVAIAGKARTLSRKYENTIRSSLTFMILAAIIFMDFGVVSYDKRYTLVLLAICYNDITFALKELSDSKDAEGGKQK